jgi:hypothetical protein
MNHLERRIFDFSLRFSLTLEQFTGSNLGAKRIARLIKSIYHSPQSRVKRKGYSVSRSYADIVTIHLHLSQTLVLIYNGKRKKLKEFAFISSI